ncbi:MAG: hypothetical protein AUK34_04915 [Ignavibacteria bacterium CG2_30_36_16]|nr:hypothetical protein [Ignavibacteria bacterium]OIP61429.1 MAG: hypothetical protein AUK34_04915 [Ignavibacteria bacterium CG2_30_36_16]
MKNRINEILNEVKRLAKEYKLITGRVMGVTGEIAENETSKILGLELVQVRNPGYDSIKKDNEKIIKYEIKGRIKSNKYRSQRTSKININEEWDKLLLTIMNDDYEVLDIYEADKKEIVKALQKTGSKARSEKFTLSLGEVIRVSQKVWSNNKGL